MNKVLQKVLKIVEEGITTWLPEVNASMLEEDGKVYYMNGDDGTVFDWGTNSRLCEFMSFYDKTGLGAIKVNVLSSGTINVYVYRDEMTSCFKEYQESITKEEALELAVLMYNIADKKSFYDKAVDTMDTNMLLTKEYYEEFESIFR